MVYLLILLIVISAYEIWRMVQKQQKKEIVVFIVIAVLAFSLALFYISNPYRESLARKLLRLIGSKF